MTSLSRLHSFPDWGYLFVLQQAFKKQLVGLRTRLDWKKAYLVSKLDPLITYFFITSHMS